MIGMLRAVLGEHLADLAHVVAAAHERRGDVVDAVLDREDEVGAVLGGHRGHAQERARQVHALAVGEVAAARDPAADLARLETDSTWSSITPSSIRIFEPGSTSSGSSV